MSTGKPTDINKFSCISGLKKLLFYGVHLMEAYLLKATSNWEKKLQR